MVEILKDTEQRLVIALGTRGGRWTKLIFDKEAGRAWFERHQRIWPARMTEAALHDITAIETSKGGAGDVLVALKPDTRLRLAGDAGAPEAVARIRDFVGIAPAPAGQGIRAAPDWLRPFGKIAAALAAIALLGFGVFKAIDLFVLPGCDASRTRAALLQRLQTKADQTIRLSDFVTVSREARELRCRARVTLSSDTATVGYRSYWDGWKPMVRVTGPVGTARLDPSRLMAIDTAYDRFMELARDAYQTGNPPRQFDPAIYSLLTTIFEVNALPERTLAGADIDEAIRWFNSGDTVGSVYVLAGTGVTDFAKLPANDAVQKQLRNNVVSFSDEYGRSMDFQVTLLAVIADAQANHAASGPPAEVESAEFKTKVAGIKPLLVQALKSDFISLVYEGLSDNWRFDRLMALARIAPITAKVLSRGDAAEISDQALQTLPYFKTESVKARVAEVARMIAR